MTRFIFTMLMISGRQQQYYEFDGECDAQCVKEADAIIRTLANKVIDENPTEGFAYVAHLKKPLLTVVQPDRLVPHG